ncbi:MAG: sigma-54 dependent transcriptional regulator [Myxococcota bacterium]
MRSPRAVLVVDDDVAMGEMVVSLLDDHGIDAECVGSADSALAAVERREFDAVLSDIRMPGRTGLELLGELRERCPDVPVVLMTAFGSIDSAVAAMRGGAFHYVTKPFKREEVLVVLERAFEHRELERENARLRRAVDRTASFGDLLGASPAMREIFAKIRKVADSRSSVLITGESGTGKEVVARTLHFSGSRREKPFIPINCTAIPEGLLESELFGHRKGAFTGADSNKEGLFARANGGTLFLDEIGDMGGGLQSKLLRVLQDGEVRPVGGTESVKVDVRIVAATNKDLRREIEEGRFRRDLFYRLNVIPLHIPPLRERPEDVEVLARAFVERHADGALRRLSTDALRRLERCHWEGNARELENVIERSLAMSENQVLTSDDLILPDEEGGPMQRESMAEGDAGFLAEALAQRLTLRELEDRYTDAVLEFTGGNKMQAAKILGINRRTLYRRGDRAAAGEREGS